MLDKRRMLIVGIAIFAIIAIIVGVYFFTKNKNRR